MTNKTISCLQSQIKVNKEAITYLHSWEKELMQIITDSEKCGDIAYEFEITKDLRKVKKQIKMMTRNQKALKKLLAREICSYQVGYACR